MTEIHCFDCGCVLGCYYSGGHLPFFYCLPCAEIKQQADEWIVNAEA